mmetsp:Transcript_18749/g.44821  ORF Transcript_18749/g.44821 Transcript_18749/m.44821 type:complete len:138 (+) Transcript_18749:550-963(+)
MPDTHFCVALLKLEVYFDGVHSAIPTPRLPGLKLLACPKQLNTLKTTTYRSWWIDGCTGWQETLESLYSKIHTEGPFQGVLGFSQGATTAGLLCTKKIARDMSFYPRDQNDIRSIPSCGNGFDAAGNLAIWSALNCS